MEKELVKTRAMQQQTMEELSEKIRDQIVKAMRMGRTLALDFGKLKADFTNELSRANAFEAEMVFDRERFWDEDEYLKIVRQHEMHTAYGLNPGSFIMLPTFNIVVVSSSPDPEFIEYMLDNLPHRDQFVMYKVHKKGV